jgi:hypothetical protein
VFYCKNLFLHFELGKIIFTISVIATYYFPETPKIISGISIQKLFLVKLKHFLIDVPACIAVPALVWDIFTV